MPDFLKNNEFIIKLLVLFLVTIFNINAKTVHTIVALCDLKHQNVLDVPERLAIGDDLKNNLYWGCGGGVKSFFLKRKKWKLIKSWKGVNDYILERVILKHIKNTRLLLRMINLERYMKREKNGEVIIIQV